MENIIIMVTIANNINAANDNKKYFSIFFVIVIPINKSDIDNIITSIVFTKRILFIRSFFITKYINMINIEHNIAISCFILYSVYWIFIFVKIE